MKDKTNNGIIAILIYNFLIAVKSIVMGNLVQQIDHNVAILGTFLVAALFFLTMQVNQPVTYAKKIKNNMILLIKLNLASFGAWYSLYMGLRFIDPSSATAISTFTVPVIASVFAKQPLQTSQFVSFLIAILGLVIANIFGLGGMHSSWRMSAIGEACVIGTGISIFAYSKISKQMHQKGWSVSEIMGARFWLMLVAVIVIEPSSASTLFTSPNTMLMLAGISFVGVILPLSAFQMGVKLSSQIVVASTLALLPIILFAMQFIDSRLSFSVEVLGCIVLGTFGSLLGLIKQLRTREKTYE